MFFVVNQAANDTDDNEATDDHEVRPDWERLHERLGNRMKARRLETRRSIGPVIEEIGHRREELERDKEQNRADRILETRKFFEDAGEYEVERAKAKDREDIGREDDVRILRDTEDGGNGVDRKDHVTDLDDDERKQKRRHEGLAINLGEEMHSVDLGMITEMLNHELGDPFVFGIGFVIATKGRMNREINEQSTEDPEHPLIAGNKRRAASDHRAAHDKRAQNAPKQHAMLIFERDTERGEDHRHNRNIVERQTFLDQVARNIIHRGFCRIIMRTLMKPKTKPAVCVSKIDKNREQKCKRDPEACPFQCFFGIYLMNLAIEYAQI